MNPLRQIPSIHELKTHPYFEQLKNTEQLSEESLTDLLQIVVKDLREQMLQGSLAHQEIDRKRLIELIFARLRKDLLAFEQNFLRRVINATGIVLHTNLGRARLSNEATAQLTDVAKHYSTLEYQLTTGERGSRHDLVEHYIKQLTGAEGAIVVNNNAAAVFFVLKALASHKEVIVSQGELVEIGGAFRIPDMMALSEAELISVGTSNKTYLTDYERAITNETALFLKVHKSNFKLLGFTNEVDTSELVKMSKQYQIPIYEDLGSGTLFDFKTYEIGDEPTIQEKVQAGIDLISFSGDKLLGGPQAGVIVGKTDYIEVLKRHPLARILRVDKFTLAGLEATLKAYIRGKEAQEIPTIRDITTSDKEIKKIANCFKQKLQTANTSFMCMVEQDYSEVGGGTMPEVKLNTYVAKLKHPVLSSETIAKQLRFFEIPIIVRIQQEMVVLDFRTIKTEELSFIVEALQSIEEEYQ